MVGQKTSKSVKISPSKNLGYTVIRVVEILLYCAVDFISLGHLAINLLVWRRR